MKSRLRAAFSLRMSKPYWMSAWTLQPFCIFIIKPKEITGSVFIPDKPGPAYPMTATFLVKQRQSPAIAASILPWTRLRPSKDFPASLSERPWPMRMQSGQLAQQLGLHHYNAPDQCDLERTSAINNHSAGCGQVTPHRKNRAQPHPPTPAKSPVQRHLCGRVRSGRDARPAPRPCRLC